MSTIDTVYSSFIDSFSGNGSTTAFDTTFPVYQDTSDSHQLIVKIKVVATDVETTLTEVTDYTVTLSGANPSLATVTLTVAPATGTELYLINDIQATQDINFNGSGNLDLDDVATAMNKAMLAIQQNIANQAELAVQLSATSGLSGLVLGTAVADGIWKWNTAKTAVEFVTIGELVSSAAFDISELSVSTALIGTDHLAGYDISLSSQVKSTINDIVQAGLLGLTSLSDEDKDTIKTNLGIVSGEDPVPTIVASNFVTKTDKQTVSTVAGEWTDISSFTLTHTMADKSNKVLVIAQLPLGVGGSGEQASVRFLIDDVPYEPQEHTGTPISTTYDGRGIQGGVYYAGTSDYCVPVMLHEYLELGHTSSFTVKVQVGSPLGSDEIHINSATTEAYKGAGTAQLQLIEFSGNKFVQRSQSSDSELLLTSNTHKYKILTQSSLHIGLNESTIYSVILGSFSSYDTVASGDHRVRILKDDAELLSPTSPGSRQTTHGYGSTWNHICLVNTDTITRSATYDLTIARGATTNNWYSNYVGSGFGFANSKLSALCMVVGRGLLQAPITTTLSSVVDTGILGTDGTVWADPSLSVTITPTSSTSTLWITGSVNIMAGDINTGAVKLQRDGSDILKGDANGSATRCTAWSRNVSADQTSAMCIPFSLMVTSGSTSATTIKALISNLNFTSAQSYMNRGKTDTDSAAFDRSVSTLTVHEIVGS